MRTRAKPSPLRQGSWALRVDERRLRRAGHRRQVMEHHDEASRADDNTRSPDRASDSRRERGALQSCWSEDRCVEQKQTAHLQAALLRLESARAQIRTAQQGSNRKTASLRARAGGITELACCRSDLFNASSLRAWWDETDVRRERAAPHEAGAAAAEEAGETLTWNGLKSRPLVITAQRIRAFLLASATTAICHPERSRSR